MMFSNRFTTVVALGMASLMVTACGTNEYGRPHGNSAVNGIGGTGVDKSDIGTLLGAGLGAWAGSNVGGGKGNIAAIAVGTLLGAGLGNSIGASLDRADLQYYNGASQQALETAQPGQTLPWSNPQSGNSGSITPSNYYQTASGQYCREYTQTIQVGNRKETGYGRACRQPDGTWQIVE